MDFESILNEICQALPESYSAVVMNLDGLTVARRDAGEPPADVEAVLVELLAALKAARQAAEQMAGQLLEMTVDLGQAVVVLRTLGQEHFVALLLSPRALQGRGRYLLRVRGRELVRELS